MTVTQNIFADGELDEKVVVSKMETTTPHGAMAGKDNRQATCSQDRFAGGKITNYRTRLPRRS